MTVTSNDQRRYPQGVPSWVDCETADLDAGQSFYSALFGWEFEEVTPPGAASRYLIARLEGHDLAGLAPGSDGAGGWRTFIACDDVEATAAAVERAGGQVERPLPEPTPGGRSASCVDPGGAAFRLWEAGRRLGAQLVNTPGTWNFSDLRVADPSRVVPFYAAVLGWAVDPALGAGMIRLPGYGDHLAATIDPDIHERQRFAPPGFADVVAGMSASDGSPQWQVRFTVADRDESASAAERAGGTVLSSADTEWTREALVRDPGGAELVLSQFAPSG